MFREADELIIDIPELSERLSVPAGQLYELAFNTPDEERYHSFEIPKSDGSARSIDKPVPSLMIIQRRLARTLEQWSHPHYSAHGFVRERGIKTNAMKHLRKPWVLNLDLKDFFPSIVVGRVCGLLKGWKIPPEDESEEYETLDTGCASLIANLCCFRQKGNHPRQGLPQGAPSSPVLSNLFVKGIGLDRELYAFASRIGVAYTRYADDISFSPKKDADVKGYEKLVDVEIYGERRIQVRAVAVRAELEDIFHRHGFALQKRKTRLQVSKGRQEVTGLVVNEIPNVPRREIRWIRSRLDLWEKRGLPFVCRNLMTRRSCKISPSPVDAVDLETAPYLTGAHPERLWRILMGKLLFVSMVRGKGDPVYLRFRRTFLSLIKRDLLPDGESLDAGTISLRSGSRKILRNMGKMLKVDLDDFPRRSNKHMRKLRADFDRAIRFNKTHPPDIGELRKTELGAWAYERLEREVGWEDLDSLFNTDGRGGWSVQASALQAEAYFLLSLNDDLMEMKAKSRFADLWLGISRINGTRCSEIFGNEKYKNAVLKKDWGKYFQWTNKKYETGVWEDSMEQWSQETTLHSLAKNPAEDFREQPFGSFLFWMAVAGIESDDDEIKTCRNRFQEAFDENPDLWRDYDIANDKRGEVKKQREKLGLVEFRDAVLRVWKAYARKA